LKSLVLAAVQAEARKVFDARRMPRAQKHNGSSEDLVSAELNHLSARAAVLERQNISLYEDFADGKMDKKAYLPAKIANSAELDTTRERIAKLERRKAAAAHETVNIAADEPLLRRVIEASELTDKALSLVDRIVVFDGEHIEIRFAFGDTNTSAKEEGFAIADAKIS